MFYGASLTKQCLGFLVAQAVEARHISVDDGVRSWLPELPTWTAQVRLHHLLSHISGLPDVTQPRPGMPNSNTEVIDRLRGLRPPPQVHPGERFAYNNTGYVLLAETVAPARGRSIADLAEAALFDPLAMSSTRLGGRSISLPGTPDPPGTIGDGGLRTSIADLLRWLAALNDGTLDGAADRRMETVGRLNDGSALDYAWGVQLTSTTIGRQVSHGGSWAGWLAKTVRFPHQGVAVAVLSTGAVEAEISGLGTGLARRLALA